MLSERQWLPPNWRCVRYAFVPCVSQDALDYVRKLREVLWPGLCKDATPPSTPSEAAIFSEEDRVGVASLHLHVVRWTPHASPALRPLSPKHGRHCLRRAQREGVGVSERPEQGSAEEQVEVVLPRELGMEEEWEAVGACLGRTVRRLQLLVALVRQDEQLQPPPLQQQQQQHLNLSASSEAQMWALWQANAHLVVCPACLCHDYRSGE